jgi:hypothetical protein
VDTAGNETPPPFTVVRELFPRGQQRHCHVVGDEPWRSRELAHVCDQVDRVGRTRREKVTGAGHEHLFSRSKSNT